MLKHAKVWMGLLLGFTTNPVLAQKTALDTSIQKRSEESWQMARSIWGWAELGYHEDRSAALLAKTLKDGGFHVQTRVAGIPTAFVATIGDGQPVIGLLAEYDALPGLSQEATPERKSRPETTSGHGCGHHLFGVATTSAALALAEQIRAGTLKGTIRLYGCPAEEGGSAKAFMVRAGLFKGCDAVLHWHPSSKNSAGAETCMARVAVKFRFHGKSAHAAESPESGRSALDAVALTNHAAELLREHTPDFTRIHHVITAGGGAPNVVPDFAEVFYYIRHPKAEVVRQLYPRLLKCAEAGALATETKLETEYLGGTLELLPNEALARLTRENLASLNDLSYDEREKAFAATIQPTLPSTVPLTNLAEVENRSGQLGKGSTDVGDVSWVVPTAGFDVACWVPGTAPHSWQAVAAGGTSIGRKGMQLAARVLAASAWDLLQNAKLLEEAKAEHQRLLIKQAYQPLLGEGQQPPLNYRDAPVIRNR